MNAFSLLAYHQPKNDYTAYCDKLFKHHFNKLISAIEVRLGCFAASDSRSLDESVLVARIDRLWPRREGKIPVATFDAPMLDTREHALVLLQSLYNFEEQHIVIGTGRSYLNFFPELSEVAKRPESVNLIILITLGKLFRILGYQWVYVQGGSTVLRLYEYISIYYERLCDGWVSELHQSAPTQELNEGYSWKEFKIPCMLATELTVSNTSAGDVSLANDKNSGVSLADDKNSGVSLENDKNSDVSLANDKNSGVSLADDKNSGVSTDYVSDDEPLQSNTSSGNRV